MQAETEAACQELVRATKARGAPDNVTVAILRVKWAASEPSPGWRGLLGRWS
jgi:serine/threonine protein phosphatase PrpC